MRRIKGPSTLFYYKHVAGQSCRVSGITLYKRQISFLEIMKENKIKVHYEVRYFERGVAYFVRGHKIKAKISDFLYIAL